MVGSSDLLVAQLQETACASRNARWNDPARERRALSHAPGDSSLGSEWAVKPPQPAQLAPAKPAFTGFLAICPIRRPDVSPVGGIDCDLRCPVSQLQGFHRRESEGIA